MTLMNYLLCRRLMMVMMVAEKWLCLHLLATALALLMMIFMNTFDVRYHAIFYEI